MNINSDLGLNRGVVTAQRFESQVAWPEETPCVIDTQDGFQSSAPAEESTITLEGSSSAAETSSHASSHPLMGTLHKIKDTAKNISKDPIGFVRDHKMLSAGAGAVTVSAAGGAIGALIATSRDDEALSIVTNLIKDTTNSKIEAYSDIAEFVGLKAAAGVIAGSIGHGVVCVAKMARGIKNTVKGIKKKDALKTSKGLRTTVVGVKRGITAGIMATHEATGTGKAVNTVLKKTVRPVFRGAGGALNVAVGAQLLAKGVKEHDKRDVIQGALDLSYGTAVVASMAVGGPVLGTACTVLLFSKNAYNFIKTGQKFIAAARKSKAAQEAAETDQSKKPAGNAVANNGTAAQAAKAPDKVQESGAGTKATTGSDVARDMRQSATSDRSVSHQAPLHEG